MHGINMEIAVYWYTVTDWGNPDQLQLIIWWAFSYLRRNSEFPFYFPSVGVYWWDFVQHLALPCSPSCKVEVIFTVSGYPHPIKKISWFICIGGYSAHSTRVRRSSTAAAECRLTLPQLPYVTNLAQYVPFSILNWGTLFHLLIVSNRNIYLTGTSVSAIYLFY